MTISTSATGHLVDPDLVGALDALPPFAFTAEALPTIRQALTEAMAARPSAAVQLPGVSRVDHTVPGAAGDPDVRILRFSPDGRQTSKSALVWMHAGGYVIGAADDDDALCRHLAAATGAVVLSVDYRLAPETPAPGSVHDCYAALQWVHEHADELGVDRARIAVGGSSAGAGLAASLAVLARDRGDHPVSFQALVFPMLDDRTASTVDPHPYAGEFVWTPTDNRFGWTAHLGTEPGGPDTSPYAAAARVKSTAGLPPTFLSVGSLDLFAEEGIEYATRLLREGVPTELHVYPGACHGFMMAPDARVTRTYLHDLTAAIDRHVNG